jgi:hypothetical protein
MMTFSINTGTNTETTSFRLNGELVNLYSNSTFNFRQFNNFQFSLGSINYFPFLIERLPNNKNGLINPPDLRDFILSVWSSTIFKLTTTTASNIPYIGIDTLNPDDNDLKNRKILLGKKQYQSNDIVTDDLINSDYDILFYNTKNDNQQQFTTRIGLLSGNTNFQNSPFIQSQTIFGTTSVSFDFNSNGDINIISQDIEVNEFKLPNGASASDGKVISWSIDESSMIYNNLTTQLPSTIGTSSQALDIFGDPTNINGYDFNFTDNRKCSVEIGDIRLGENFSNFSISEILQRIVYQYLPPISTIEILPPNEKGYVEFGQTPNVVLDFSIFKRSFNTNTATLLNMIPGTFPAITTEGYSSVTGTASGLITSPLNTSGVTFSVIVGDGTQTTTSSTNIRGIYPYFYGFSSQASISNLSQLTKLVESKTDKNIIIQPGSGFFYFIYDDLYGDLDEILDQNNVVFTDFDLSTQTLSSPNGLWVNKEFKVYRINTLSTSIPIIFKFKY